MKNLILSAFLLLSALGFAQTQLTGAGGRDSDTPQAEEDTLKPPIEEYKIISIKGDTTHVDTTLNIYKNYRHNYRRKDNFELLSFHNTGLPYNELSFRQNFDQLMPGFGAGARHLNFFEKEDIQYYFVPTPVTELYFKTVPEQGQQLDALFTINTSDRLNFSVAYKGVRALGKYQNSLTSTGVFRTGLNYQTLNRKYQVKAHFVSHNLMNQENGGLDSLAVQQYLAKEEEFQDRSLLEVQFEDAQNDLHGKRFYLDHLYHLSQPRPDNTSALSFGHILNYNYKRYVYRQNRAFEEMFGPSFDRNNIEDVVRLSQAENEVYARFNNEVLGDVKAKAAVTTYDYGYNTLFYTDDGLINSRLQGVNFAAGGSYKNTIGPFEVEGDGMLSVGGDFHSTYLNTRAAYVFDENNSAEFGFNQNSRVPDYNFLLYQSNYINYNWQNDFDNVNTQHLFFNLKSRKIATAEASLSQVQNYAYFGLNEQNLVRPYQYDDQLRYLKIKAHRNFDLGLFGFDNTIMYQNVLDGASVLKLPDFVTRNSLYYKDYWFQRALYLQTGFTFRYFTSYEANGYDPVLAEFYVQDDVEIGNYPVVDFFFNGKVDQTRVFFKLENVNSLLTGNNNFTAPRYPYTDFMIRFGLVWNFFM